MKINQTRKKESAIQFNEAFFHARGMGVKLLRNKNKNNDYNNLF